MTWQLLCLSVDDSDGLTPERLLALRLVHDAVDMKEIRRSCTDTTQLGQVRNSRFLLLLLHYF